MINFLNDYHNDAKEHSNDAIHRMSVYSEIGNAIGVIGMIMNPDTDVFTEAVNIAQDDTQTSFYSVPFENPSTVEGAIERLGFAIHTIGKGEDELVNSPDEIKESVET